MIGNRVLIIAEAGVNHNGSLEMAKQIVGQAKWAGADIIKFQTWKTENVVTRTAPKVAYQKENDRQGDTQYEMLKKLELPYEDFLTLHTYCEKVGIEFMSTADEYESASFLQPLQKQFKVGSAELTDWPFLRKLAAFKKPIILSTGMADLDEIRQAVQLLKLEGVEQELITVLHCSTLYPTPFDEVNLQAMKTIQKELGVKIGYSDHTVGIEVPIAAVALGAKVIEKHFTLDRTLPGPDHKASTEPREFKQMVESIRNIELALGSAIKEPTENERKNRLLVRKSIVAKRTIQVGEMFTEDNIAVKRPGLGLSPIHWDRIIGKTAKKKFDPDELIFLD